MCANLSKELVVVVVIIIIIILSSTWVHGVISRRTIFFIVAA
jgi:hypothetical protein